VSACVLAFRLPADIRKAEGAKVNPIVTPDNPDVFESVLRERTNLGPGNARQMKGPFI
jgi:hypothetical protein